MLRFLLLLPLHYFFKEKFLINLTSCSATGDYNQERLRLKIIERLVKEGSSADEPTNINLSDYSSDEGDTSSSSTECAARKERNPNWTRRESSTQNLVPLRPPSSTFPKKESRVKQKARGSSARTLRKISVVEKTPTMPRKPLQVHKTTLDGPCIEQVNDITDLTTEVESGDDSSWPKGSRKLRLDSRRKKMKKRSMPPELIVTPAQVFENTEVSEKEGGKKKSSPDFKRKSVNPELTGEKFRLWHHAKCLQSQSKSGKSINDLTTEIQLKLGATLRQRVWTGCRCTAIHGDIPLSKAFSPSFTHWSKGPFMWTSNYTHQSTNENSTKNAQRLNTQQQNISSEETQEKQKKSRSKKLSKSSKPNNQPEDEDLAEYSKKSKKKPVKKNKFSSYDHTTQVAMLKLTDSKPSGRRDVNEASDKTSNQTRKIARAKLRKSGFIATAVSRYRCDSDDSESEGDPPEKLNSKKKKKRKTNSTKKFKRVQSAKETTEAQNKGKV